MHAISAGAFIFWMLIMAAFLAATHDYGVPVLSVRAFVIYGVSVIAFYIMGAVVWFFTWLFARTSASRMITVFAFGWLIVGVAGEIWLAPHWKTAGVQAPRLKGPLASLSPSPAAPSPKTSSAKPAPVKPPPVTATSPASAPSTPGCERREDRERDHVTITCR